MLDHAQSWKMLEENRQRIRWIHADYSSPSWSKTLTSPYELVIAVDPLHHLSYEQQKILYQVLFELMIEGEHFLMSDHMITKESFYDAPQYSLWMQEILDNMKDIDKNSTISKISDVFTTAL